ncbi:MAG TPA: SGNH/GDSL hydrolase family protein [Mycobacteriales bacterium]|nr:SGNH/GDSL hydrolase family protein [Mycobacteriales bacterium]
MTVVEPGGQQAPASDGPWGRWLAVQAAYGGGIFGALGALGYLLLRVEARMARLTIGEPTGRAPIASGSWGRGRRGRTPLRLVVLGDSSAAGLGCGTAEQTPGALLAGSLARELDRRVLLDVHAVVGARAAALDLQVSRAMASRVDAALIMIGANDVTHRVSAAAAARDLARAVATLRAAGAVVVVGTCPDLGTVKPLWQPLRAVARIESRRMARAQTVAVVEADGISVSLADLLGDAFGSSPQLWSADRFHPSPQGYARVVEVLLPAMLQGLGVEVAGERTDRDSVQDVALAASVAAYDPGLVVETVAGVQGAAAVGPGRLARLVRRVPVAERGEPEGRTDSEHAAAAQEAVPDAT